METHNGAVHARVPWNKGMLTGQNPPHESCKNLGGSHPAANVFEHLQAGAVQSCDWSPNSGVRSDTAASAGGLPGYGPLHPVVRADSPRRGPGPGTGGLREGLEGRYSPSEIVSGPFCIMLLRIHHTAIICSNYEVSRRFYTEVLGLQIVAEHYREHRRSYKLDLMLPDGSQVELFSFPDAPPRPSWPEACGLRHLAFAVDDVDTCKAFLESKGISVEAVRIDEYTNRRFVFFADPDGLPLELYEVSA